METSGHNDVTVVGGQVRKEHGGPDGAARAARAAAAMRHARAVGLPVPRVLAVAGTRLVTRAAVPSVSGADLLPDDPAAVLAAIGRVAARLRAADAPHGFTGPAAAAWVHGDLCPVNLRFDTTGAAPRLVAVIDWEDSRVDDPLVDVAWTEWLVRTWHPAAIAHLPALHGAHGRVPPPDARRAAMASCLARQRDRDPHAGWDRRLAELAGLDLS